MKYLLILSLLLSSLSGFAQKPANNPIDIELSLLISRKAQYERWRDFAKEISDASYANKYAYKRDSVCQLYMDMIRTIKKSREVYLVHINKAIKAGKVDYDGAKGILYNYFNQSLSSNDWDLYFLPRLEAYKIIKRSLFEKNERQLPERTDLYTKKGGKGRVGFTVPPIDAKDTLKSRGDQEIH
ncbi:hypothetical protein [Pedobacter chitinilyticus]|uniref:Uncharacterized protein n=1 Tax=Pedobacter chitinilyticus TaxID=2233776 RepID=A0A3S3PN42_9SPHI|nr:hypothetical protein [Pedobacter chitinilyticus]RWU06300.1 hypothetical protein DPV69_13490 [Pedobacter chitinilyticus]